MGVFLQEHLQTIMMISFILAATLGVYKVYVLFEQNGGDSIDIQTLEEEIAQIAKRVLASGHIATKEALYEAILKDAAFDTKRYSNFNQNRFNQVLERLYILYGVEDFDALVKVLASTK